MRNDSRPSTAVPLVDVAGVPFSYVAAGQNEYLPNGDGALEYRSLADAAATGGVIAASEVRSVSAADSLQCVVVGDFQTLYLLAGSIVIEEQGGDVIDLAAGDVATLPHAYAFTMTVSPGARFLELVSPANGGVKGEVSAHGTDVEGEPIISRESPASYRLGASPTAQRQFLHYRDLQVPPAVGGAVRLEIIRADSAGHSSGWHYHPMAQIVFAVAGHAVVDVAGHGANVLEPGSAIYLPAQLPHNLRDISADYRLLEAFIPGIGGTTQCDEPC